MKYFCFIISMAFMLMGFYFIIIEGEILVSILLTTYAVIFYFFEALLKEPTELIGWSAENGKTN